MSARVEDIIKELNNLAPENLALEWDNVGLQIGSLGGQVSKILLALDVTSKVIEEGINIKADLIITHHPMVLKPVNKIIKEDPLGGKIHKLIKNNMNLYVMHTNFDTAFGGTNDILGSKIGLSNVKVINPDENGMGIGRIGDIEKTTIKHLADRLKKQLSLSHVRVVGNIEQSVETVAICTGSGMSFIKDAAGKADVFITGDVKFHEAQEASSYGMVVIDVGHYGSENIAMPSIKSYLDEFARENKIEILVSQINEDPFTTI